MRSGEQTVLGDVGRRMSDEFPDVSPHDVDTVVRREIARFECTPIRDFIPLLVEKRVRQQLTTGLN